MFVIQRAVLQRKRSHLSRVPVAAILARFIVKGFVRSAGSNSVKLSSRKILNGALNARRICNDGALPILINIKKTGINELSTIALKKQRGVIVSQTRNIRRYLRFTWIKFATCVVKWLSGWLLSIAMRLVVLEG